MQYLPRTTSKLCGFLAAGLLAFAASSTDAALSPDVEPDESPMRIEFDRPADWRCIDHETCTICRNVSAGDSSLVIDRGSSAPERYDVPAEASLRICKGSAR